MKNTQDSSHVVPATQTPIRFISIERYGGKVYAEVSTADGEYECVPCEIYGAKRVLECNDPSCAKFFHRVSSIQLYRY